MTHPATHYEDVARWYEEAIGFGLPPTRTIAEDFGVSKTTAAKWVARCRRLGLLPTTTRGVAPGYHPAAAKVHAVAERLGVEPRALRDAVRECADGALRLT